MTGMADGADVVAVDDLAGEDLEGGGPLHPVQQAMVDYHGSQCGFCTPGFVMSLFTLYQSGKVPDRRTVTDWLAGNLCRCTGYRPIVDAALASCSGNPVDSHAKNAPATAAALGEIGDTRDLFVGDDDRFFAAPASLRSLAELYSAHPDAILVAGATDVGLWVTKHLRVLDPIVHVGRVRELRQVADTGEALEIGAGVTYSDAAAALAALYPDMGELLRRLGGQQVRNLGTIGGNIANGSPIGDSPPALIAMGAELVLRRGDQQRRMALEDFFLDYGKQDRKSGEFVERIIVPKPAPGVRFRAYKVTKRFDQDISSVLGAFAIELDGAKVKSARIAYGGMAATPRRAANAEAALAGQPWNETTLEAAVTALGCDFTPISDWRASAGYRAKVAGNLLRRLFIETTDEATETRLVGDRSLAHV
jgi:xanthine dehydrogenase small subunit